MKEGYKAINIYVSNNSVMGMTLEGLDWKGEWGRRDTLGAGDL